MSGERTDDPILTEGLLQRILTSIVGNGAVPGIGVAINQGGKTIECYAGKSNFDANIEMGSCARFEISCMMKFYLALISLKMASEGLLDIDAPIGKYLTDLHIRVPSKTTAICIQHLLSHTSGYRGVNIQEAKYKWNFSWDKMIEFLEGTPQLFQPGMTFNYEHSEHVILGEIIARVSGISPTRCVEDQIFSPLGIYSSNARHSDIVTSYTKNNGRFVSVKMPPLGEFWRASLSDKALTLREILSIGEALLSRERLSLPETIVTQLFQPVIRLKKVFKMPASEHMPMSFGLGAAQYWDGVIGHNGSTMGQTCALRLVPAEGLSIVVGINAWAPHIRDTLIELILKLSTWGRYPQKHSPNMERKDDNLFCGADSSKFVGNYIGSYYGNLLVTVDKRGLRISTTSKGGGHNIFEAKLNSDGHVEMRAPTPVSLGFYLDPIDKTPCLAFGGYTYKMR